MEFGQRLQRNLKNCGCLWSNWDKTCHWLHLPVGFGQRLRRNMNNCGCLWSNLDEKCHWLHLPVGFGQRLRRNRTNPGCSWSMWLGYCQTMVVVCNRLKTWLILWNFLRNLPGVCVLLAMLFLARHNCRQRSEPSTKLGRTSIETLINYNATTLPLSSTLQD